MGEIINGRYHIERELGRGGMSVVYLARDERLKRQVAVKVLHPHLAARDESRRRFLQEATAIARLEHPSILKIYDYATPQDERSYIVSQYVRGVTLKQWCEARAPLPCELVALVAQPVFEALAHAHEHQIIHRDVKPENIMVCAQGGAPILMDFGIAHLVDAETLTATGAVIGSPAHMAPEVVNGDELTASADVFSMGTVLYWMTCGALPFVAPNPAALFRRILEARFDPVLERRPDALGAFARLVERCMRRQPAERPPSARAVAAELRALLTEVGLSDVDAELSALAADAEGYRAALPARLVASYVEAGRARLAAGDVSGAVDHLRRALALDPACAAAADLVAQIGAAGRGRARWWAAAALAAAAAGGLWALGEESPLALPAARAAGELTPEQGRAAGGARRAGQGEAQGEAQGGAQGAAQGGAPRAAGRGERAARPRAARTLAPLRARRRGAEPADLVSPYKARGARAPLAAAPSAPSAPSQRVQVSSLYKGAAVWVNQRKAGHIFELERTGGLALPLGQTHEVVFRLPSCEEQVERLALNAPLKRPPRLVFECVFKPATFEVLGRPGAEIYLRGPAPLRLGVTNQEIRYKMTRHSTLISLLVVSPGQPDLPVSVTLTAGQRAQVRAP